MIASSGNAQLYTREGAPPPSAVQTDAKGRPFCEISIVCSLCGGSGYTRWKSDPLCIACDGEGLSARSDRVKLYTHQEIESMNAAAVAKEAQRQAKIAALRQTLREAHGALLDRAGSIQPAIPFVTSILATAERTGCLSAAQSAALERAVAEFEAGAATTHLGAVGDKLSLAVTVQSIVKFTPKFRRARAKQLAAITLVDTDGNALVAFSDAPLKKGQALHIAARVKEHRTWRGTRQTVVDTLSIITA